jgi:shikimate 5-dehydrogenase
MKIDLVANSLKAGMTKANPSVRNDKKILQPDSYIMDISFGIEKDDAVTYSTVRFEWGR